MTKKAANRKRGESMNPEERVVESSARKESWIVKLRRTLKQARGRPDSTVKNR